MVTAWTLVACSSGGSGTVMDASTPPGDSADSGGEAVEGSSDAGGSSPDAAEDSSDAGAENEAALPLPLVLCPFSAGQSPVAPSRDGTRVAFVSCRDTTPKVLVRELASGKEWELGDAPDPTSVEWMLDGPAIDPTTSTAGPGHVFYGSPSNSYVRVADASSDAVRVAEGTIDSHRIFEQRASPTSFTKRLLVLETVGGVRRISVRGWEDHYVAPLVLLQDATFQGDLSQLSASGRTLVATLASPDGGLEYQGLVTNSLQQFDIPFGPIDWVLAPVGLGDTHTFALNGDQLVRIELRTGITVEIVPAGSGLLAGMQHILEHPVTNGITFVHYIQNGSPTWRLREATVPSVVIATANAVAQAISPDLKTLASPLPPISTLFYLSDQKLYASTLRGFYSVDPATLVWQEPRLLVEEPNDSADLKLVFSSKTWDVAYLAHGKLIRISLQRSDDGGALVSADSADVISTDPFVEASVTFDGLGQAILFMTESGSLERLAPGSTSPQTLEPSVRGFWPVPASSAILVDVDGKLETKSPPF